MLTGLTLGALIVGTAIAGPNMRPGLWEMTLQTQMQGMEGAPMGIQGMTGAMPAFTHRQCITAKDLVPRTQRPGEQCKVSTQKIKGNTVTWQVQCDSQGMKTTGSGRVTYSGTSYNGTIDMQMTGGPMGTMKMSQVIRGKRIGDCKK